MFDLIPFGKDRGLTRRDNVFNQLVDNFFNEDFFAPFAAIGNAFRVDLKETEQAYLVEADLPGAAKEDIAVQYANNYLTISAKREAGHEETQGNYLRRERRYGQLQRSFYVSNVVEDKINAAFKDGVLTVTLPKQTTGLNKVNTITIE